MRQRYRPVMRALPRPIAGLVATCLDGAEPAVLRARALDVLQTAVGYDDGYFMPLTHDFFAHAPSYFAAFVQTPRYANDLRRAVAVAGACGAYIDTEVYSASERERLRLYRDLLGPAGIASQIVVLLRVAGRATGVIHLNRLGRSRAYTPDELAGIAEVLRALALLHAAVSPTSGGDDDALRQLATCLSPRQLDIALQVADGCQNMQVAARLGLSERTVRNQVSEIFLRLGLYSRAELALLCERAGLLRGAHAERPRLAQVLRSVTTVMSSS